MTREQAIQRLVEAGYSEDRATQIVNSLPPTVDDQGLPTGEVSLTHLGQYLDLDPAEQEQAEVPEPDEPTSRFQGREPEVQAENEANDQIDLVQSAVEAQSQGLPLSDEEAEALEDPTNRDLIIEAIQGLQTDEFNYDWVYNNLQVKPGALDNDIALSELLNSMLELGVVDEDDLADLDEAGKVTLVKEILARNGTNELVQMSVLDWAQSRDVYTPDQRIDGVSVQDIGELMRRGLSVSRATSFGRIGNSFDVSPTQLYDIWAGSDKQDTLATSQAAGRIRSAKLSPFQIAREFREGLELYEESNVLAAIHVSDPELATKLRNDPYSLDSGELRRAVDYLGGEEAVAESSDPQASWLAGRLAGQFQATATVQSEEDVKSALNTLAAAWNMTGSEGVVASVSRELVSNAVARARASLPNPFGAVDNPITTVESGSIQGYAEDRLRQTGEYQELFSNLSPGESEQEYAARFDRATQRVLGDDVVSVSRNAMRSGNVNTAYQQGLLTDVGEGSTRFQEIKARNAEIFRSML